MTRRQTFNYSGVCVFTHEEMKNYRSLEAYNFFQSGWVQTVYHCKTVTGNFVFKAAVRPSWRVTEEPHHPWVATTPTGCVIAAHCDCMAGLGETCSHVAALLFKLETAVRLGYTTTACTDVLCTWNRSFIPNIEPATVSKIQFYTEKAKQQYLARHDSVLVPVSQQSATSEQGQLTDVQEQFLSTLATLPHQAVVLSTCVNYNSRFVDAASVSVLKLPVPLTELYKPDSCDLNAADFAALVSRTAAALSVTIEQSDYVESVTTGQSSSLLWYQQRAGRITASVADSVLHSNIDNFAPPLIKKICSTDCTHQQCSGDARMSLL